MRRKTRFVLLGLGLATTSTAALASCPASPNSLTNGQVADATQVMANFNNLTNCAVSASGPATDGALAKFSGTNNVVSGDLTGDVSTSGSLVTTLQGTGVTPGIYSNPTVTVDSKGRITAASNGAGSSALLAEFVATGGETTVTLSGLSQTFENIQIIMIGNTSSGNTNGDIKMFANGDTNVSDYRNATWNQFGAGSAPYPRIATFQGVGVPSSNSATVATVTLFGYSRSDWKKSASSDMSYQDSSNFFRSLYEWFWNNTDAITSLTFTPANSTFVAGTRIQIVGLVGR